MSPPAGLMSGGWSLGNDLSTLTDYGFDVIPAVRNKVLLCRVEDGLVYICELKGRVLDELCDIYYADHVEIGRGG